MDKSTAALESARRSEKPSRSFTKPAGLRSTQDRSRTSFRCKSRLRIHDGMPAQEFSILGKA